MLDVISSEALYGANAITLPERASRPFDAIVNHPKPVLELLQLNLTLFGLVNYYTKTSFSFSKNFYILKHIFCVRKTCQCLKQRLCKTDPDIFSPL